jgi:hypothetical protein
LNRLAVALAVALPATGALAQSALFPARSGDSGLLDVPDAEAQGVGHGLLGLEYRVDRVKGSSPDFGPLPLYAVGGLLDKLDFGVTMREGGQPSDPRPARLVFGGALKLQLLGARGNVPAVAVGLTADRVNRDEVMGGRLVLSTHPDRPIRFSAFAGGEAGKDAGVTYGGALAFRVSRDTDAVLEGLGGPRGENYGAALRFRAAATLGVGLAFNYFPGERGFRVSIGLGFGPQPRREVAPAPAPGPGAAAPAPEVSAPAAFADDQPRFRLKLRISDATSPEPRSLRFGPFTPPSAAGAASRPSAPGVRAAAPSLEDLAEAQLKEQEALADARERRVRATGEQLDAREKAAQEGARKLEDAERDLASREQQLDVREKRAPVPKGPPAQQQRQLESLEAQLASQERNLGAQERSFVPAIDAAQGREREAAAREDAERREASRLAASVSGASSRALQVEVRKQALAARNRQLASLEARLVAKGERIDVLERQLRARSERIDAWQRRLDARADRIDLAEKRAAEERAAPAGAPRPAEAKAGAAGAKAVFVMVVKSPTAIVKERAAAPGTAAPDAALHPGVMVEKAVAAATMVMFATPASRISELDREAVEGIARLAARERCELLIWARAREPGLMGEAQRRAAELRTLVLAAGPLEGKQVVTRLTTRPGAEAVDVVVSALRETAKAPAPAAAAPPPSLLSGETGKRQIREAVQAAQPSIEACMGEIVSQKNLQRAEGVLRLTVSAQGRVTKVAAGEGDLSGTSLEECLGAASRAWLFPPAEGEYAVDVPITVLRGGSR